MTRSGFDPSPVATRISAGIVVSLICSDGRSENTSVPPVARLFYCGYKVKKHTIMVPRKSSFIKGNCSRP